MAEPVFTCVIAEDETLLRQALFDQCLQGLTQSRSFGAGLLQACLGPPHGNGLRRIAGDVVLRIADGIGVRHVRFDIEHWRAVQQIDAGQVQAAGFHPFKPDHRLPDAVRPMRRASREDAERAVATQARWTNPQPGLGFERLVEKKQQPDMTDPL